MAGDKYEAIDILNIFDIKIVDAETLTEKQKNDFKVMTENPTHIFLTIGEHYIITTEKDRHIIFLVFPIIIKKYFQKLNNN